jgi:hypothetical protein
LEKRELPAGALDVMLKEHALLRDEIKERLKTAFSHVAYAGAIAAFAIPAADKVSGWVPKGVPLTAAALGFVGLLWVALLNMRWVQHGGAYLASIEKRVNEHFGEQVLGWEHYADSVRAKMWLLIPSAAAKLNPPAPAIRSNQESHPPVPPNPP